MAFFGVAVGSIGKARFGLAVGCTQKVHFGLDIGYTGTRLGTSFMVVYYTHENHLSTKVTYLKV